ncbi:single-stranded DNA-binding protein [Candidatus Uhrbacteria bacterium CG10_big_fil_rev_8_21_14_0_10_48_11]|uniref:Single-stranded DNA-binding protein n=1 Tax=Candidatus Uhrbacteria bacterium CG10_big_fil_rev_8_21_14_0_10_48_11 TaxID=1975037 RepID=A0A2M8LDU2_9BACT|nr:MAG: single-stranded DNA-binding protein [Candidatus Uhrbacteria bacterium CG10_big_fil_rev_8_21_14_0_10_48_11]
MSLNKVLLIGNLTRDPETRSTPSGQNVTTFGVATNRSWTTPTGEKQERTEFHNVVAWGKLAEIADRFLGKGRKVYIEGRLQTREWEGQDGAKRSRTEIVAENFIMLDRAGDSTSGGPFRSAAKPSTNDAEQPAPEGEDEIQLENIPF